MFPQLNLPSKEFRMEVSEGKTFIWDEIRKKMIVLTPEEWVRQHVVSLLITEMEYPKSLIKVESGLKYWKKKKRSDIVAFDQNAKPYLLIECKSWEHKINKTTLNQIATYNKSLQAPYIAVTNGIKHFCWKKKEHLYDALKNFPTRPNSGTSG